jgi:uncharacterized protein (TIGR02145 family)
MNAQVGIGTTTPDASSILDVDASPANDKGFLPPRLTTAQRDAIATPAEGLMIYNTENNCLETWNATDWISICDGSIVTTIPSSNCPNTSTTVVDVPAAGYTWMDRNLGASQAATSSTDAASYGDLYQWGRCADGHQIRTSSTTSTNATTAVPNTGGSWDGQFITEPNSPDDWLATQDNSLWQGVSGTNNPCPAGYRVPTEAELSDLDASFGSQQNAAGAFSSPVKMPMAGYRFNSSGNLFQVGFTGNYWSSTVSGISARTLYFFSTSSSIVNYERAFGFSVRCIKD